MDVSKIELHDEKIIGINMVSDKAFFDIIYVKVEYQDNVLIIQCKDCYSATLDFHMYISGCDTIRNFIVENVIIEQIISKYPEQKMSIPLKKICFNLNTTNSDIEIIAKDIMCYFE